MTEILHQISFAILFFGAVLVFVVGIERFIFSSINLGTAKQCVLRLENNPNDSLDFDKDNVVVRVLKEIQVSHSSNLSEAAKIARGDAAYLFARDALFKRLWILETIVTAAPLLGLLGTIFGIVETFLALSKSGMSDPSGVSAGIGTALYATALGISVALIGILAFNYLKDRNERICEYLKILILRKS
jgi:biopolymer transport protein ExbB